MPGYSHRGLRILTGLRLPDAEGRSIAGRAGMTLATEGRRTPDALAGATQDVVGIRVQFIPEFNVGDWEGAYSASMSEAEIEATVRDAEKSLRALAETLRDMANVSTAERLWYETEVNFYGDAVGNSEGRDGTRAGRLWSGRSIEGLASADRFNREGRRDALEDRRGALRAERAVQRRGGDQGAAGEVKFSNPRTQAEVLARGP